MGLDVPFLDLGATYRELKDEIDEAMARVLASGWYLLGSELEAFEQEYAQYVGAKHCIGVGNGLDALQLSLRTMDIGPGDEVIVPSNTYIATWLAVSQVGATIVPVEPVEQTYNIDPSLIEAAITDRTRAILPVHLYGQPVDIDPILEIANRRGLRVLDDAAQCHGASYKGARIGSFGDATAWSFYPTKNLGAYGDAGAVTTNDGAIAERLRLLRNYGQRERYVCEEQGYNSRLDEIRSAILRVKLRHLEEWTQRRKQIANEYLSAFAGLDVLLPHTPTWADPVWHLFVVRHRQRDEFQRRLKAAGIGTIVHYPIPPHLQQAYAGLSFAPGDFPIAEAIHREVISLPLGPQLTNEQVSAVIQAVRTCS
jgi:dTDP-4-amino-4,6-dideoxygalactose transaminase